MKPLPLKKNKEIGFMRLPIPLKNVSCAMSGVFKVSSLNCETGKSTRLLQPDCPILNCFEPNRLWIILLQETGRKTLQHLWFLLANGEISPLANQKQPTSSVLGTCRLYRLVKFNIFNNLIRQNWNKQMFSTSWFEVTFYPLSGGHLTIESVT